MKKLLFACLAIVFTFLFSFSQGVGSNPELPVLVPQSPEAYALGKYGEVDVNESTGSISPSIPLYTYKAGNISVPISLAYSGNGVKVDQRPTTTGINWSLIAGGAITRQVRDRADELAYSPTPTYNNRKFYDFNSLNALDGAHEIPSPLGPFEIPTPVWITTINNLATNTNYDSEVDIFNYNFLGYSGSFYIDENWEPQLIKYDKEIKIDISELNGTEIVNSITIDKKEITITTPDGVQYLFGGNNHPDNRNSGAEYSSSHSGTSGPSEEIVNSFYITQITHPNTDTVNFEYDYESIRTYLVGLQQSKSITNGGCGGSANTNNLSSSSSPTYSVIRHQRTLSKIYSSRTNDSIVFNRIDFNGFEKTLNEVIIKNGNNIIKKYKLDYYYPTNLNNQKDKFFLKTVDEQNSTSQSFGKKYILEYDEIESLPEITTLTTTFFPQDYYGYFNDKPNSNLIPSGQSEFFDLHFNGQLADREPDFEKAKYGSLKSITYPTGGSTHFEYESGIDLTNATSETHSDFLTIYHNDVTRNDETLQSDIALIAPYLDPNGGPSDIPKTQTVTATYNIETDGDIIHKEWVRIQIREQQNTSNIVATKDIELENPENSHNSFNGIVNFDIVEGTNYEVVLKFMNGVGTTLADNLSQGVYNDNDIQIVTTLRYDIAVNSPPIYADALGIRVKSITNKLADDSVANYKRYYYNAKEFYNYEFPQTVFFPMYYRNIDKLFICEGPSQGGSSGGFEIGISNTVTLQSSSLTSLFIDDSSKKMYPYVTVSYGGNNFENGGKEMEFIVKRDGLPYRYHGNQIYTSNRDHNSLENGTKLKEIIFKKTGSIFQNLKETTYNYRETKFDPTISSKVVNVIAQKEYDADLAYGQRVDHINIGLYETYSRWHGLESIVTKEIFAADTLTTTQTFDYQGNLAGIPTHETTTGSDGLKTLKRTYYPDEISSASYLGHDNLTTDEWNAISRMKENQQYRIANPIQVKIYTDTNNNDSFESTELLNTQRTNYFDDLLTNQNIFIPQGVQTAKEDNTLEDRITYHSYYDNGNIKELSKTEGAHIVYVWGYDEQYPIAKIENTTFADVSSLVSNLESLSDLDVSEATENTLRNALNDLRNETSLSEAMITTYTYDPLIGVTSITDPRGRIVYYIYDEFNRLKFVKDHDGNVLNENEYNYAPQN